MGIAKWSINNMHKDEVFRKRLSSSPTITDPTNDMEVAYAHVRYQKSFDSKEKQIEQEDYESMKQSRMHKLKPIAIDDIK